MPPRLADDTVPIVRALLEGEFACAAALLKPADAFLWFPVTSKFVTERDRRGLAGQAAARLLDLQRQQPDAACRLFLLIATGETADQAKNHPVPLFVELQQLAGQYGAGTGGHINRSAASFDQGDADAEPALTIASCGAENMTVLFDYEMEDAQGGGSYKVQAVLKRSEFFTIAWQTLPQPVGFTVQPDGRSCEVEEELPLDGSRRLLQTELGGQTYTATSYSRTKFSLPTAANAEEGQHGSVTRFCTLNTTDTHVMLFRLERVQRVFEEGGEDELVGPEELGQLLDSLGVEGQLGTDQPQLLVPLLAQAQHVQHVQQAQQAQQPAGEGGMQAAGLPQVLLPQLAAGLPPGFAAGLHMPQQPLGAAAAPAPQQAVLAAQQAALLASQQAAAAALFGGVLWPNMPLPLGAMPIAAGFQPHVLAPGAAGGQAAPAQQPIAPSAAAAGGGAAAEVPIPVAAAASQPAGMPAGGGGVGSSGGGSGSSGGSGGSGSGGSGGRGEIADLQEAQSATEDAVQLLSEDFETMSVTVDGHGVELSDLRRDVDDLRRTRSTAAVPVEPAAATAAEQEEGSSQPGKRRRSNAPAAATAAAPSAAAASHPTAAAASQPAASPSGTAAAASQPAAGGTVLPSDVEVRRLLVEELLDPAEGRDKLQLCRAMKERLRIRISSVGDLTRVVNRVLSQLERESPPKCQKLAPREGTSKPLWKRIN